MDLQSTIGSIGGALVGAGGVAYYIMRKVRREFAADGAEKFANDWHQQVIARQDVEAARLREEIAVLREHGTQTTRRLLEVELRERVKEKIIRDIIKDIRLVKSDQITLGQLNTGLLDDIT